MWILQEHFEGRFPLQRLPGRLREGIGGEEHVGHHRLVEPGKEGLDERLGMLPALGQLRFGL